MVSANRFWVGSNNSGVLVFDKEMQIDGADHVFLWSVRHREMQQYAADLARPHLRTVKDNEVVSSAIESYLAWHGAFATSWLSEELRYQGARKAKGAAEEQARRSLAERHAQYLASTGLANNGTRLASSRNFHRTPPCWRCGKQLDNSADIECISCGWIICSCGACGCSR